VMFIGRGERLELVHRSSHARPLRGWARARGGLARRGARRRLPRRADLRPVGWADARLPTVPAPPAQPRGIGCPRPRQRSARWYAVALARRRWRRTASERLRATPRRSPRSASTRSRAPRRAAAARLPRDRGGVADRARAARPPRQPLRRRARARDRPAHALHEDGEARPRADLDARRARRPTATRAGSEPRPDRQTRKGRDTLADAAPSWFRSKDCSARTRRRPGR
jgi:hypothetical protein